MNESKILNCKEIESQSLSVKSNFKKYLIKN